MFTGIVESTRKVVSATDGPMFRRLVIAADPADVKLGESIAINGVCLTVCELGADAVGFDVIKETLSKTNLGRLRAGDDVNLERTLRAGDRIDGHFVQGHVDGTGKLVHQLSTESEVRLTIQAPKELAKYLAPKGSISVDGVSMTIAALRDETFELALIPTTLKLTTLGTRPLGWPFNLEADILSKTIVHFIERREGASGS